MGQDFCRGCWFQGPTLGQYYPCLWSECFGEGKDGSSETQEQQICNAVHITK